MHTSMVKEADRNHGAQGSLPRYFHSYEI